MTGGVSYQEPVRSHIEYFFCNWNDYTYRTLKHGQDIELIQVAWHQGAMVTNHTMLRNRHEGALQSLFRSISVLIALYARRTGGKSPEIGQSTTLANKISLDLAYDDIYNGLENNVVCLSTEAHFRLD